MTSLPLSRESSQYGSAQEGAFDSRRGSMLSAGKPSSQLGSAASSPRSLSVLPPDFQASDGGMQ